ncbi:MAG TPA: hypothetical protein VNJ03_06735 [Vicinamibacterales bacterium]|nr:hypothetical protein [Vicinamibacterales bacterium]
MPGGLAGGDTVEWPVEFGRTRNERIAGQWEWVNGVDRCAQDAQEVSAKGGIGGVQ